MTSYFFLWRVYVRNISLSYYIGAIGKALKSILGPIKYIRARTKKGKLTGFRTGDIFVDIVAPKEHLHPPPKIGKGISTVDVYHQEQKQSRTETECGNCKESGHTRRDCSNQPVCYDCSQPGHTRGSGSVLQDGSRHLKLENCLIFEYIRLTDLFWGTL